LEIELLKKLSMGFWLSERAWPFKRSWSPGTPPSPSKATAPTRAVTVPVAGVRKPLGVRVTGFPKLTLAKPS